MNRTHLVKGLFILLTLIAIITSPLGLQPAKAEQIVSYGWENGTGTVLGAYGNVGEASNSTEQAYSGSHSLKIVESPLGGTPQAYVFWVTGLTEGDTITASFWVYDITPSANPSGRIWGHYTAGEDDIENYQGSASGNYTYSDGTGWSQLSHTWTFDSDSGSRDGLVVEARIYSGADEDVIYIDDAEITVSNDTANIYDPGAIPTTGELIINEVMYHPSTSAGNDEWFEVKNVASDVRNVNGCVITDGDGGIDHTITDAHIIIPGRYYVFGANSSTTGVDEDYDYGVENALANTGSGDTITLTCNGVVVDEVDYEVNQNGWPASEGISISFGIPNGSSGNYHLDNDSGSNWGDSTSAIGGGNTDLGTPGAVNDDVLGPTALTLATITGGSDHSGPLVYLAGGAALLLAGALFLLRRRKTV